ncbi:CLUMA_CG018622, isoform A [Clunio marinus]|uniref:CLUMA_CG018622, isoform A n=1 Tax=Clunio marinus TaxID=568069 RepID=A0A1J1IYC3_9DIPT|nr:CLUMA_CG018622, isoform A [Clunio marinus]
MEKENHFCSGLIIDVTFSRKSVLLEIMRFNGIEISLPFIFWFSFFISKETSTRKEMPRGGLSKQKPNE